MKIYEYKIINAKTFYQRLIGLTFKNITSYGMLFSNCHAIHTFFMKFNIDVLLIKNNKIIDIKRNVHPNQIIYFKHKKTNIIELPYDISHNYKINDSITDYQ